ncbi:hypothetical protein [Aeoliella sp.]|uniref:hypothetical protein n=1 Tax=Aeoliella sp. TaxID=2795800 RepID=UPI003CCC38C7
MVKVRVLRINLFVACCLALTGCQSMPWMRTASNEPPKSAMADLPMAIGREGSSFATPDVQQAASFADPNALASASSITPLTGQELAHSDEVLRELNTIGAVDPVAAQQLVERLQETKPSLRPLVARQFRTSWQYHRDQFGANAENAAVAQQPQESVAHVAQLPPPVNTTPPAEGQPPTTYQPAADAPLNGAMNGAIDPNSETMRQLQQHLQQATQQPPSEPTNPPPANTEPQAAAEPAKPKQDGQVVQAGHAEPPKLEPIPVQEGANGPLEVETPRSWQEALGQTIDNLADDVAKDPRSTDEAYQHVRLRLMQLVAGDQDLALEPIPGLTPTEQSYWKNQLFAIATLLDHEAMPEEQARAALAAEQLSEAAARLGELSDLELRNMSFCEKVYGFGDYRKHQFDGYKAGQQVKLYAEVDNFRSESDEKGYHTSLATSYEVLDQAGNLVEGGEFAIVEDYCSRKRQDFYIEYTVHIPKQIYPSKYELRLTMRDRLSGKIGKSSVMFEIVE